MDEYAIAISIVSLVVTVLGWRYTYDKQKELLIMQKNADKEKSHYNIVYPMKMERIKDFLNWLMDGDKIFLRFIGIANITKRLHKEKGESEREKIINEKTREMIQKLTIEINDKSLEWMPEYVPYRTMITTMKEFESSNINEYITEYYFTVVEITNNIGKERGDNTYDGHVRKMIKIFELVEDVMNKE